MEFSSARRTAAVACIALWCGMSSAQAEDRKGPRWVGAGISFPAFHQAAVVNAAGLTDSNGVSAQALVGGDNRIFQAGIAGGNGSAGASLAAQYGMQSGTFSFNGGLAGDLGALALGLGLQRTGLNGGLGVDLGTSLDLSRIRISGVVRGLSGTPNRVDFGLGWSQSGLLISADIKVLFPMSQQAIYWDVSVAYNAQRFGLGVGVDGQFTGGSFNLGGPHFGVSIGVTEKFNLEGYYRPSVQDPSSLGTYVGGARLQF